MVRKLYPVDSIAIGGNVMEFFLQFSRDFFFRKNLAKIPPRLSMLYTSYGSCLVITFSATNSNIIRS